MALVHAVNGHSVAIVLDRAEVLLTLNNALD
jgi:hypothetical protein